MINGTRPKSHQEIISNDSFLKFYIPVRSPNRTRESLVLAAAKRAEIIEKHNPQRPSADKSSNETSEEEAQARYLSSHQLRSFSLQYTYEELFKATNGFSDENCLSKTANGSVFKGTLKDGTEVAVKVFLAHDNEKAFSEEVTVLSKFRHPNLVILMGFAQHTRHRLLVYEMLNGGDVRAKLQTGVLLWQDRIRIGLDAVRGLSHLHSSVPIVFHRDIKTANILLDEHGKAKVADFGLACLSDEGESNMTVKQISGTLGYADPRYVETGIVREETEVYSFGMVLLELLTRRPPVFLDDMGIHWVLVPHSKLTLSDIIEHVDKSANFPSVFSNKIAELSMRCVQETPSLRPSFKDLVKILKDISKEAAEYIEQPSTKLPIEPIKNQPSAIEVNTAAVPAKSTKSPENLKKKSNSSAARASSNTVNRVVKPKKAVAKVPTKQESEISKSGEIDRVAVSPSKRDDACVTAKAKCCGVAKQCIPSLQHVEKKETNEKKVPLSKIQSKEVVNKLNRKDVEIPSSKAESKSVGDYNDLNCNPSLDTPGDVKNTDTRKNKSLLTSGATVIRNTDGVVGSKRSSSSINGVAGSISSHGNGVFGSSSKSSSSGVSSISSNVAEISGSRGNNISSNNFCSSATSSSNACNVSSNNNNNISSSNNAKSSQSNRSSTVLSSSSNRVVGSSDVAGKICSGSSSSGSDSSSAHTAVDFRENCEATEPKSNNIVSTGNSAPKSLSKELGVLSNNVSNRKNDKDKNSKASDTERRKGWSSPVHVANTVFSTSAFCTGDSDVANCSHEGTSENSSLPSSSGTGVSHMVQHLNSPRRHSPEKKINFIIPSLSPLHTSSAKTSNHRFHTKMPDYYIGDLPPSEKEEEDIDKNFTPFFFDDIGRMYEMLVSEDENTEQDESSCSGGIVLNTIPEVDDSGFCNEANRQFAAFLGSKGICIAPITSPRTYDRAAASSNSTTSSSPKSEACIKASQTTGEKLLGVNHVTPQVHRDNPTYATHYRKSKGKNYQEGSISREVCASRERHSYNRNSSSGDEATVSSNYSVKATYGVARNNNRNLHPRPTGNKANPQSVSSSFSSHSNNHGGNNRRDGRLPHVDDSTPTRKTEKTSNEEAFIDIKKIPRKKCLNSSSRVIKGKSLYRNTSLERETTPAEQRKAASRSNLSVSPPRLSTRRASGYVSTTNRPTVAGNITSSFRSSVRQYSLPQTTEESQNAINFGFSDHEESEDKHINTSRLLNQSLENIDEDTQLKIALEMSKVGAELEQNRRRLHEKEYVRDMEAALMASIRVSHRVEQTISSSTALLE